MAPPLFSHTLTLDGKVYEANRTPDPQLFGRVKTPTTQYAPKVGSALINSSGAVTLDPINITTFHRGAGASRRVVDGMFSHSKNAWTCDPGILMPGPAVTNVSLPNVPASAPNRAFWEQDGHLFVAAGRYVHRIPIGSGTPVLEQDLGVGAVVTNVRRLSGSVIVSIGTGANIWQRPDGGPMNQTVPSGAGVKRGQLGSVFWTTGGVTAERLVGQDASTTLRYTTGADPRVDGNWTPGVGVAAIDVGPYPISSFVTTLDHLYVLTQGGIRDLDSSGIAPLLTPETESMLMTTNGQAGLAAGGYIYGNYGYGLIRVPVTSTLQFANAQWVTPMLGLPNESPVSGVIQSIIRRGHWIIAAQWDSSANDTWISWGRDATQDEPGPMTWHVSPIYLHTWQVNAMWISGLVPANPRLWMIGTDGATVSLKWAHLALGTPYQDIRQGRPYQCATSFSLWTQREDAGDDAIIKDLEELAIEDEAVGSGSQLTYSVASNGATVYSQIGSVVAPPRVVLPTVQPVQGNTLQFQIDGSGLGASPPIQRKMSARFTAMPDYRRIKSYQLRIGRTVTHAGGSLEGVDPQDKIAHLEGLQQDGTRVSFSDEDGKSMTVRLNPGGLSYSEIEFDGANRVLVANVQLIVVATAGGQSFGWDGAIGWDTPGYMWS